MPPSERTPPYVWLILALAGGALAGFLVLTKLAVSPFVVLLFGIALLYPHRHSTPLARHLLWLLLLASALWLIQSMGLLLLPFGIALLVGYLLDPILAKLERHGIPRWLSALALVLGLLGGVAALSVLIFPTVFSQLDTLVRQLSTLYTTATTYLESRRFFQTLERYGIPPQLVQEVFRRDLLPRLEQGFQILMSALLDALAGFARIVTHVVNLLLLPIAMFYLLKDFPKLRAVVVEVLQRQAPRALAILLKASPIVRTYLGWITSISALIGLVSGALYVLLEIPYGVMLGLLSGLFNPIPYFGILITMGAGAIAILIAQSANFLQDFLLFSLVINGLHFLNAYIVEPRVLGHRIGVHPVLLIFSLILFGTVFGFVGLLVAVPTTAVAVLLFNEWRHSTSIPLEPVSPTSEQGP
ncbi:MAG: AI-2E family transporter [Chlorobiota bacterium]